MIRLLTRRFGLVVEPSNGLTSINLIYPRKIGPLSFGITAANVISRERRTFISSDAIIIILVFAEIDHKLTPLGKLNCMLECYKSIAYVVALSSSRGDNASADDILPLFINVILKSFPRRMYSSLKYTFL